MIITCLCKIEKSLYFTKYQKLCLDGQTVGHVGNNIKTSGVFLQTCIVECVHVCDLKHDTGVRNMIHVSYMFVLYHRSENCEWHHMFIISAK